jgi:hypothetical protein
MASLTAEALVTNVGRQRLALLLSTGKSFKVTHFVLGDQGHNPDDPTIALAPDPSITTCLGNVFGPKLIAGVTFANASCPVFQCVVDFAEAVAPLSSICLIATIVYSPIPFDPEVLNATQFLFSVATFPLFVKSDLLQVTFDLGIQF